MSDKDTQPVPNLNSPPGMTPPHQPPPTSALSAPQTSGFARDTPIDPSTNPQAKPDPQKLIYYSCLAVTLTAPAIALLPPRRLNPQSFGLAIAWCASAGVVLETRTGHGLLWHVGALIPSQANAERRAREREREGAGFGGGDDAARAMREGREAPVLAGRVRERGQRDGEREEGKGGIVDAVRARERQQQQQQQRGVVGRIWMGREGDDWIEKRAKEEREALEDGRGYGGLIADYVSEAFGVRRWLGGDDEDEDEGEDEAAKRKGE